MRYRFLIVDVFSATPFGGNQLAVITDARGISTEGMQAIAQEFNFPETTFILPTAEPSATRRVRIFTPERELPFAGHPTVGTACALVMDGQCASGALTLEEGIGEVRVDVAEQDGGLAATLTVEQRPELPDFAPDPDGVAAALSLPKDAVLRLFCAGLGVPFTFVQLPSAEVVDRACLDGAAWSRHLAGTFGPQLHIFSGDLADGGKLYARMFAPAFGIPEDPATGSAAGALAGAAASLEGFAGEHFRLDITQGVAMGRPSLLNAAARLQSGQVTAVQVGGATTFVAEGEMEVPLQLLVG